MHPAVAAVVAAHAVLVIVVLGIAAQVLAHALAHLVDVVGVNAGQPEVGRDRGLLALQPDDLTQALRGIDPVHLVAPLPDAFVGAAEGERVALPALPQRRFDSLGLGDVGVDHDVAAARQAAVAVLQAGAVRPHALDTPLEARQPHLRARFDFLIDPAAPVLHPLPMATHHVPA